MCLKAHQRWIPHTQWQARWPAGSWGWRTPPTGCGSGKCWGSASGRGDPTGAEPAPNRLRPSSESSPGKPCGCRHLCANWNPQGGSHHTKGIWGDKKEENTLSIIAYFCAYVMLLVDVSDVPGLSWNHCLRETPHHTITCTFQCVLWGGVCPITSNYWTWLPSTGSLEVWHFIQKYQGRKNVVIL